MAWKSSIPWLGSGAAMALGFLWARRALSPRGRLPQLSQDAAPDAKREQAGLPDINLDPDVNLDAIAREDALHDMGDLDEESDFDDTQREPLFVDPAEDIDLTVARHDHAVQADEPYDALDAEDVGTAWLRRATESETIEEADVMDALEGTHEIIDGDAAELDLPRESNYGADQSGDSLLPHAGTHDADIAAELPVGTFDASGNAELHAPVNPPDALEAPASGVLSPNDDEMARRDAAHVVDQRRARR